jgi:hypothetical protein
VLGLGNPATLADGGGVSEAAPPDGGSCALKPHPNPNCQACLESNCCALAMTCNEDPACVSGVDCTIDCGPNLSCVNDCFTMYKTNAAFGAYAETCAASACAQQCVVDNPTCKTLYACCQAAKSTLEAAIFATCQMTVASDEPTNCQTILDTVQGLCADGG